MPIPSISMDSVLRAINELLPDLREIENGPHRSTTYDMLWEGHRLPPKVVVSRAVLIETGKPLPEVEFSGGNGTGQANTVLRQLGFEVVAKSGGRPALPLDLYGRYTRKEVYATKEVSFSQQNQNLTQGLSPRLNDGGYFIFVTLNKEDLPASHGYEDELFADEFVWVTRRDRDESHTDYIRLREPVCRVSLFVRTNLREKFAYLGELQYKTHRQFTDVATDRAQQRYTWLLEKRIPEELLEELTFGSSISPTRRERVKVGNGRRSRMPSSFDQMKKAYS